MRAAACRAALASAVLLAGCDAASPPPPRSPSVPAAADSASLGDQAHWQGFGPLRLGSDSAALQRDWPGGLEGEAVADGGCYYLQPVHAGPVRFMVEGDRLVRYDVDVADVPAPGGGRVGMSLAQLQALYPAAAAPQPHKYVPQAAYLRIVGNDSPASVLVFEIASEGTARSWRLGLEPQVDYVEHCG